MLHVRHHRDLWIWGPGVLLFLALAWNSTFGQNFQIQRAPLINPQSATESPESGVAFVTSREMTQRLRTAKQRIIEQDYITGVRYLQSLLDEREDWFIEESHTAKPGPNAPPKNQERKTNFLSLKNAVEEVVGNLPADARRIYEQEYGISAKGMLKAAVASGDLVKLSELARRFFHTEAGYEAVYRLGLIKADHGEPFAAALHFGRLKAHPKVAKRYEPMLSLKLAMCWDRAGLRTQSLAVLRQLKRESPNSEIRIGAQTVKLFDRNEDASQWLAQTLGQNAAQAESEAEQWPVFRGNASRNATSGTASPTGPVAWSRSTIRDDHSFGLSPGQLARVENKLEELIEDRKEDKHLLPVPVAQPLILGNLAIFRTLQNLQAVDLKSGELLWKTAHSDARLRPVLSHASPDPVQQRVIRGRMILPNGNMNQSDQRSALETFLVQRTWRDTTFGLLSGDSRRVYSVEDVGLADGMFFAQPNPDDPFLPKTYNKLMAFDVQGGQAEWEAGGPATGKDDPLGGTFFLGSPLPIGEQLFCLGERNNEISLLALEASTGKLEWEQRLVLPALNLLANRERRVMGLSPTFGQGVMICPTASGAVVAVDVTRRMLLWAYEYESNQTEDYLVANMAWQRGGALEFSHESIHPESRWADSVPLIAEGRVLITPSDSQAIHCLDLSTGEQQWMVERGQGIYLAGVENGLAIVVSRSQVRALRLTDGRDAWSTPVSIPMPAGRGYIADGRFHLPFASGEVGTIDLKQGRLTARSPWPKGQTPGNLISAGGRVVFQSPDAVGAFASWDQMTADIAAKLKTNPDDADSLALRGVLRLHRGEEAKALEDLGRAWTLQPTEEIRSLIVSRMLEGLRTDASKYQAYREELRQLIRSSEESLQFLMLTASSANTPEARTTAFRDYLQLARTLGGTLELQKLSEAHHVRVDWWVKARIDQLAEKAEPEELDEWNRILEQELPKSLEKLSTRSRLQVLSSFPRLPAVEKAELAIIAEWGQSDHLLEKTVRLNGLRKSPNAEIKAKATLALAEIYLATGREAEAYPLIQEIGKTWPKGWREGFNDLKPPETLSWPERKLKATLQARSANVLLEVPIRVVSANDTPFAHWSFSIDQATRRLIARDENGIEGWHLDITETNGPILDLDDITLSLQGHMGVLSFQTHFAVLDLMNRKHRATVLWSQVLMEDGIDLDEVFRQQQFRRNQIFGGGPPIVGNHFGWVKLLSEELIVYQVGERITAADPLTGEPRWIRDGTRRSSRIFGDEKLLAVIAPDATTAFIARATDGEILENRNLPHPDKQAAFLGMNLVTWSPEDNGQLLQSRHLQSGEVAWKQTFPKGMMLRNIGNEEAALFHPDGTFHIVSLAEGKTKVSAKLAWGEEQYTHEVCRLANCYLLLSSVDQPVAAGGRNPFQTETTGTPVNGPVHAFDRKTGKLLWKAQIEDQSLEKQPPYHSPVIVFNKRKMPGQGFGGFNDNSYRVQILDVRTGDSIYEHNKLKNASPLGIRVLPADKQVTIKFYEGEIEVKSTEEPLEPAGT